MSFYRVHKTKDYTVISNQHLKESNLSLRAKGLLSLLLSLPEDWNFSAIGLAELSKDGRDATSKALDELEKFGYLHRTPRKDEDGKFAGFEYDVFEQPQKILPFTEKPFTVKPSTDLPSTVNPTRLNTKELNTKELNTKKEIYTKKKATSKRSGKQASKQGPSSFVTSEFFKKAVARSYAKQVIKEIDDGKE